MFTRQFVLLTATVAAMACSSVSVASPIQVDGDLSDWDVVVSDGNESNFYHLNPSIGLLGYHRDDQSDSAGDGGYLGPHYGGQNYDAEFMGVALQDSMLYVAIVTGQRPDNGLERYSPGDILIVTSNGLFGIEVGGGKGGNNGSAITELALDTTMYGDNTIYGMFWAPSCDNDELWVGIDPLSTGEQQVRIEQVPEPTEIALFGLGLSALGVLRRRRRPQ